ncbi:MAG: aminopeptidase P family protein, partial [Alphaproteobacteria bacterium]
IRIENLVVVQPWDGDDGARERDMLCFETLTLAPIDRTLISRDLLDDAEIAWLDAYHARVRDTLTPVLDRDTARWLAAATQPF